MPYDHQIEVLTKLASYQKQNLQRGFRNREIMHQALDAGIEPEGYRADWIRKSCLRVFSLLEILATEFNAEHTNDRCSSLDLLDIIQSTLSTLQGDKD